ncbi:hypothetical protein RhiirA1_512203 [Rhizophagus irregularis]|uniref:Uncharacterized protein n=1 Tax=Rhizophagus irregularis TaxID=588596 RepID=A0A2I1E8S2_9GLOM|nr:hypothetical protein RhiirA1_512203 [Rhizophagus irregularis]PKY18537.1 hypothetical protein RhiirB3_491591 [Rhizophagus irregularis]
MGVEPLLNLKLDILREEPDFSSIKSNNTILDYGPCGECDIPILTEDPPRLLVLNVCDDMIHRTCAKAMYKDGTLLCSCDMADNSDPLLPFQYSIVDYGGREKSSISGSERLSFVNLKNLGYNILKSLEDKTVRDITFPKLDLCSECGNDILMSPLKAFLYLTCGHIFHKLCIEKKPFLDTPSTCLAPSCKKNLIPGGALNQAEFHLYSRQWVKCLPYLHTYMDGKDQRYSNSTGFLWFSSQPQVPLKSLVYLTCKHIVHYDCINDPRKLCPICPSTNATETDDMETDDDDMVTNNLETQSLSTTQKKRTRKPAFTEKSSNKKSKKSKKTVDWDNSPTLQRLIKELSTDNPGNEEEILQTEPTSELNSNSNIFLNLYNKIVDGEDLLKKTTQDILCYYFDFREALKKRYNHYRSLNHGE